MSASDLGEARTQRRDRTLRRLGVDPTPLPCGCPGLHRDICPERGECTDCGATNSECLGRLDVRGLACCTGCQHPAPSS